MLVLIAVKRRSAVGVRGHDVRTVNVMASSVGTLPRQRGSTISNYCKPYPIDFLFADRCSLGQWFHASDKFPILDVRI